MLYSGIRRSSILQTFFYVTTPCASDGSFLKKPIPDPEPARLPDATPENPWTPFHDRLAFDWARYHYVRLQSSEDEICEGLELWRATVVKHESEHGETECVPWKDAQDLYKTIDLIKAGNVNWTTFKLSYTGPKPQMPPRWMEETYELNTRDVLVTLEQQLGTTEFDGQFEMTPYEEYDHAGDRVLSNLMSGYWANREAVRILQVSPYGLY